jgi:hypothetical protein
MTEPSSSLGCESPGPLSQTGGSGRLFPGRPGMLVLEGPREGVAGDQERQRGRWDRRGDQDAPHPQHNREGIHHLSQPRRCSSIQIPRTTTMKSGDPLDVGSARRSEPKWVNRGDTVLSRQRHDPLAIDHRGGVRQHEQRNVWRAGPRQNR